jgi:hypothetical protein
MDLRIVWLIVVVLVLAAAAAAWFLWQRRRSEHIRRRFGPEYERTIRKVGDRRRAEAELAEREKRVEKIVIRPLAREDGRRFHESWLLIQKRFVDAPREAAAEADRLVNEVLRARGYPAEDFEKRAEDVSVHYPHLVSNYRAARAIADRSERNHATTEDLRKAVVYYRDLFEELLETRSPGRVGAKS